MKDPLQTRTFTERTITVPGPESPTLVYAGAGPHARTVPAHPATEVVPPQPAAQQLTVTGRPADIVRYGPGVPVSAPAPASQGGTGAEQVWRGGRLPEPPRPRHRLRRVASGALTVILLAAAGGVLYLRSHHGPFRVTGVAITQQVKDGCAVDVTGRIATSGAAGTVSYQWEVQPQLAAPQPVSQSVAAGQDAVYVTAALQAQGHGSTARTVTLQLLGPGTGTASTRVVVGC